MRLNDIKKTMNGQPRYLLGALLVVPFLGLMLLLKSAGAGQVATPPQVQKLHSVEVFPVEFDNAYQRNLKAVGRAEASKQATMGFELSGTLLKAYVDEGQFVQAGQLVAELDTRRLSAQMQEIDATVTRAEADARLAELSEQRIVKLVQEKLESPQRLDEARERTVAAQARVREVIAGKSRIQVELDKSKLYAPFSGTILSRPVDPGSVVGLGQAIYVMQQGDNTEVRIALGADQAFSIEIGKTYPLQQNDRVYQATAKSIANARRLNTRTIDIIFEFQDPEHQVLPGDLLTLSIPQQIDESGFWVPKTALASGIRGLWTLYTVANLEQPEAIVPKSVSVLYSTNDHAYVAGALESADLVVINGAHRLVTEQLVQARLVDAQKIARR